MESCPKRFWDGLRRPRLHNLHIFSIASRKSKIKVFSFSSSVHSPIYSRDVAIGVMNL